MPRRRRTALLSAAVAALLLSPALARASPFATVNPGITLSYTAGHGVTYGFEVSVVWIPATLDELERQPFGTGIAVDVSTNFTDLFKLRVGGEIVGPFIGVEAGPALVVDRTGAHLGLSVTPWAGWYVMPYYTYTLVLGEDSPNLHEFGTYLKLYLDPSGSGASHHHSDW